MSQLALLTTLMSQVRRGATGSAPAPEPPPPPPEGLEPSLIVSYWGTDAQLHEVDATNGETTITVQAPARIQFDLSGTRSDSSGVWPATEVPWDCQNEDDAYFMIGARVHFDNGRTGTWAEEFAGGPMDEDVGPPLFDTDYTEPGTYNVRCRVRDPDGREATIPVTIVVENPGAGVDMTSGVFPTWADNTVYNAPAGGTWGSTNFNNRLNIVIRMVGEGADPVFGTVSIDNRNDINDSGAIRPGGIRFQNIDIANFNVQSIGFDWCSAHDGRVRQVSLLGDPQYIFTEAIANNRGETVANNCRFVQGVGFFRTGEMTSSGIYVLITGVRQLAMQGVWLHKNDGTGGGHVFRGLFERTTIRHCNFSNTGASTSYSKINAAGCIGDASTLPDPWRSDNRAGDFSIGRLYGYPTDKVVVQKCQFRRSGDTLPAAIAGAGPENNDPDSDNMGVRRVAYEDVQIFGTQGGSAQNAFDSSGARGVGFRGNFYTGNGNPVAFGRTGSTNRVPPGWNGPYFFENTNTRPIPTPFD